MSASPNKASPVIRGIGAAGQGVRDAARVYSALPKPEDWEDICENLIAATYFGCASAASFLFEDDPKQLSVPDSEHSYFDQEDDWDTH